MAYTAVPALLQGSLFLGVQAVGTLNTGMATKLARAGFNASATGSWTGLMATKLERAGFNSSATGSWTGRMATKLERAGFNSSATGSWTGLMATKLERSLFNVSDQGTLTGALLSKLNRSGYDYSLDYGWTMTGTVGLVAPGSTIGYITSSTEGAGEHTGFVAPRAGSIVRVEVQGNATFSSGSVIFRPRWGGTYVDGLKCVVTNSTAYLGKAYLDYRVATNATNATFTKNATIDVRVNTPQSKGNPTCPSANCDFRVRLYVKES